MGPTIMYAKMQFPDISRLDWRSFVLVLNFPFADDP
jgi:hypothetical protein